MCSRLGRPAFNIFCFMNVCVGAGESATSLQGSRTVTVPAVFPAGHSGLFFSRRWGDSRWQRRQGWGVCLWLFPVTSGTGSDSLRCGWDQGAGSEPDAGRWRGGHLGGCRLRLPRPVRRLKGFPFTCPVASTCCAVGGTNVISLHQ